MQLGYIGFEVTNVAAWKDLLVEVIGLTDVGENADGSNAFRMDERPQRLFVQKGTLDDVCALGLCADSIAEYDTTLERLAAKGIAFEAASDVTASARGVARLVKITGPYNAPFEFGSPLLTSETLFTPRFADESWLTGQLGVGHLLLLVPKKEVMSQFLIDCFGFAYSNTGKAAWNGVEDAEVDFLHCNPRHHSLAPASVGQRLPKLTGHFMLEKNNVDAVGKTYDRARKAGLHITNELGRHTDGAISFYARTPSGFDFEVGAESYLIDERWNEYQLKSYSIWGHNYHPAPESD